jgi:hypothetical protein
VINPLTVWEENRQGAKIRQERQDVLGVSLKPPNLILATLADLGVLAV